LNGIVSWDSIGSYCFLMVLFLNMLCSFFVQKKKNNDLFEQVINKKNGIKKTIKILLIVTAFFLLAMVTVLLFGVMDRFRFWILVVQFCLGMIMLGLNIGQYISLKKKINK